jgi:hypothetical protein
VSIYIVLNRGPEPVRGRCRVAPKYLNDQTCCENVRLRSDDPVVGQPTGWADFLNDFRPR